MFFAKERKNVKAHLNCYMDHRDFPKWFRGLSYFQVDAANALMNNLRDDSAQGTTHRVRDTLINLGIQPVVKGKKIEVAMKLSRGNDMAFLWFLMELYYRHTCDDCMHSKELGYTSNEQVFMTVIAHLDTIATLREMDRLLPPQPPQPPKKNLIKKKIVKEKAILPYLERQPRPTKYGKSLYAKEPWYKIHLGVYDNYRNPNYVVHNMNNRWFADYKLKEEQKVEKKPSDKKSSSIKDPQSDELLESANKLTDCAMHGTAEILKRDFADELKTARKQIYEKFASADGYSRDQPPKEVKKAVNKEIEKAKEYFNKMVDTTYLCANTSQSASNTDPDDEKNEFFQAPTCNKPYKFNYDKIFDIRERNPIQEAIVKALKTCSNPEMLTDHDEAVRECCKEIWEAEVNRHNRADEERKKLLEEEEKAKNLKAKLGFDLPYYDPSNRKLMEAMISKVLQEIGKDKRYVLASMPEAYKYPILRAFIKKRFGMIYSREVKNNDIRLSKKIFYYLQKDEVDPRIPMISDVSKNPDVSYKCKDYILRKTNKLQTEYRHNFAMALLDYVRICWAAVRPFQCPKGPPRDVFFAYLPARESDVLLFRPWRSNEFNNAKQEWDRRQARKLSALKVN